MKLHSWTIHSHANVVASQYWDPTTSNFGFMMFAGWIAWLFLIVILVTSLGPVRKMLYELFRWCHWLFLPMMIFASAHSNDAFCFFQVRVGNET
jgi:predicted ferric reductase